MTRERISRTDMLERARRTGVLTGKSLRTDPGSHTAAWFRRCREAGIPYIALSLGRHHARVTLSIRSMDPDFTFDRDAPWLKRDLLHAVDAVRRQSQEVWNFEEVCGPNFLTVSGITNTDGKWLANRFADITARHHRELAGLPANVVNIDMERRKHWQRKGAIA